MQGRRASILTAFAMLLAFAGCNSSQPAAAPAPGAVPAGPSPAVAKQIDPPAPNLTIIHRNGTNKGEAHQLVQNGTLVEWEYDKPGYYVYFPDGSPCTSQTNPLPLNSTSGTTEPYTTSCTINTDQHGVPLPYEITKQPPHAKPTKPAQSKTSKIGSHCEGCVMEVQ